MCCPNDIVETDHEHVNAVSDGRQASFTNLSHDQDPFKWVVEVDLLPLHSLREQAVHSPDPVVYSKRLCV